MFENLIPKKLIQESNPQQKQDLLHNKHMIKYLFRMHKKQSIRSLLF